MPGWPCRAAACRGSTSQVRWASGKRARSAAKAGRVRTTSPRAPSRMTRMRSAGGRSARGLMQPAFTLARLARAAGGRYDSPACVDRAPSPGRSRARSFGTRVVAFAGASLVLLSQNLLRRMDEMTTVGFTGGDLLVVLRCLFPMLTAYSIPIALLFGTVLASPPSGRRFGGARHARLRDGHLHPDAPRRGDRRGHRGHLRLDPPGRRARCPPGAPAPLQRRRRPRARSCRRATSAASASGSSTSTSAVTTDVLQGVMVSDPQPGAALPPLCGARPHRSGCRGPRACGSSSADGEMHIAGTGGEDDRYRRVLFERFDYALDASQLMVADDRPRRPKQMTLDELREVVERGEAGRPAPRPAQAQPTPVRARDPAPLRPALRAAALRDRGPSRWPSRATGDPAPSAPSPAGSSLSRSMPS